VQTLEAVTSPLPIEDNTKSKPLNTNAKSDYAQVALRAAKTKN
jgi:hypothetical protein